MDFVKYYNYFVYKDGRIFSLKWKRYLSGTVSKIGYRYDDLWIGNKRKRLYRHRIVAECFVSNENKKPCINHKNGNKLDNRASNLEWCTHKENQQHSLKTGLRKRIDRTTAIDMYKNGLLQKDIAALYRVHQTTVSSWVRYKWN